ncbi:MAG TPA: histidine--tRNA ligase [Turneriella sp.]|nr:histidine--tRNA ligase [Turneriella sp.]HNL10406.1 histidine--tRNA ligase [Turneriella sp.]HNL54189.1 histidine--tRNA ligase [Turneriella sp.]
MAYLSTQPYKGTRDFFPEDMRFREAMFSVMHRVVRQYGFDQIDAPIVEPIDVYLAKTSEEIVGQQIYSFTDRGDRKVAIRPEMTPTVARMVAARFHETPKPIRWYSIPNVWRYEQPGKGRLREHWQLNCDLFGAVSEKLGDLEILSLAVDLLRGYGADASQFRLYLSHRSILNGVLGGELKLPQEKWPAIARIMDKKAKVKPEAYVAMLEAEGVTALQRAELDFFLLERVDYLKKKYHLEGASYVIELMDELKNLGLDEFVEYDPSVVRGFDYYTGLVFEVFDTHPENRRSLFGGGRYNNLVGAFGKETLNAVGFGMGDVTLEDFLRTHQLLTDQPRKVDLYIALLDEKLGGHALALARKLRARGLSVEVSLGAGKLGKQFQEAEKKQIARVIILGEDEAASGVYAVKTLATGDQAKLTAEQI